MSYIVNIIFIENHIMHTLISVYNSENIPNLQKLLVSIEQEEEFVAGLSTVACKQKVLQGHRALLGAYHVHLPLLGASTTNTPSYRKPRHGS